MGKDNYMADNTPQPQAGYVLTMPITSFNTFLLEMCGQEAGFFNDNFKVRQTNINRLTDQYPLSYTPVEKIFNRDTIGAPSPEQHIMGYGNIQNKPTVSFSDKMDGTKFYACHAYEKPLPSETLYTNVPIPTDSLLHGQPVCFSVIPQTLDISSRTEGNSTIFDGLYLESHYFINPSAMAIFVAAKADSDQLPVLGCVDFNNPRSQSLSEFLAEYCQIAAVADISSDAARVPAATALWLKSKHATKRTNENRLAG
jgi:hypothetical protein